MTSDFPGAARLNVVQDKKTGLTEASPVDPLHYRRDVRRSGPFPVPYANMPSVSNLPPSTFSDLR